MMTGREVMSVSYGFWFGVIGLLVAAMVEVFFYFFFLPWFMVVSGCGVDVDVQVSFCCDFFFVSCGMGGRFVVVVVWVVGFMVTIDSVVAGGA